MDRLLNVKCKKLIFNLLFTFIFSQAYSQNSVPVDLHTGTANISIPLYSLKENDLSVPIGIYYSTTGVKVNKPLGYLTYEEYGWNLQAAGEVSRVVRDLPDDYNSGDIVNPILGWLNYTTPLFSVNSSPSCADEATYYNNLNNSGAFNYTHDIEPDIFSFNCGGLSGKFVIDKGGTVHTIPYQDVKITYLTGPQSKITGFIICNNQGYTYQFKAITKSTTVQNCCRYDPSATPGYDIRTYYQDQNPLTYTTNWGLTEMDSPGGSKITFSYDTGTTTENLVPHGIIFKTTTPIDGTVNANYKPQNFYNTDAKTTEYKLLSIQSSTKQVNFGLGSIEIFNKTPSGALDRIKKVLFYGTGLSVIGDVDCASNPVGSYKFDYYGQYSGGTDFPYQTKSIDFWGFFNNRNNSSLIPKIYVYYNLTGSDRYRLDPIPNNSQYYLLDGDDRTANPDVVMMGSLKQITYPTGETVRFEYESNEYYDQTAQTNFKGGGIRVKKITYSEGSGNSPDIVKTYTYAPSSGRLIYKPVFAYPTGFYRDWYGSATFSPASQTGKDHWDYFTIRSENDLSPQEEYNGNYVFYLSAKETQLGKGSIQNDYLIPAEYGKITDGTDWQASYSYLARASSCFDVGIVTPDYYSYPYPPNTNYSFERGLLNKQTIYNDAGQILKEKYYTYQRVNPQTTPVIITGMRSATTTNSVNSYTVFSPYKILADVTKLQSTVREVNYDPTNLSQSAETTASDFYDSPNHKLLSRSSTLLKDGTIYTTKYKYPADYTVTGTAADDNTSIIAGFRSPYNNNYMTGVVIEKTSSVQKPGQSDMVIGSSLVKYKNFTVNSVDHTIPSTVIPLPYQLLSLAIGAPVSDFVPAYIAGGTAFTADTRYHTMQTFEEYDSKGNITSSFDNHRERTGAHYDVTQTLPVLQAVNASARQMAYSGFETISTNSFVYNDGSNPVPVSPGRSGNYGLSLTANTILKQTIDKGPGQNYIFSYWIQTTNATGTLTLTLTDGTNTASYPIPYSTNANAWTYYQKIVPITQFGSSITITLSTSNSVSIDDIVFFPANSNISYYTYNKFGKTSETNSNGITKFYEYDDNGALHYIKDADQNIIQRTIYNYKASVSLSVQPALTDNTYPTGNKVGDNITFSISDLTQFSCLPGTVTYAWDFGDGTTTTASSTVPQNHTYTNYGNYIYSITVTSSVYGTQKTYGNITIYQKDFSVSVCNSSGPVVTYLCPHLGAYQWGSCNSTHAGSIGTNTFTASIINPYDATACTAHYYYYWYKAPLNSSNWQALPQYNNMTSITITIANPSSPIISDSYNIRCDVSSDPFPCQSAFIKPLGTTSAISSTIFIQQSPTDSTPCQ